MPLWCQSQSNIYPGDLIPGRVTFSWVLAAAEATLVIIEIGMRLAMSSASLLFLSGVEQNRELVNGALWPALFSLYPPAPGPIGRESCSSKSLH